MGTLTDFDLRRIHDKFGCRYLVETGTGRGGGIDYARHFGFEHIYSIEITPELATSSRERFAGQPSISILNTDSETGLREILAKLPADTPVAFWLDAHFPGADYGYSKYDTESNVDRRLPLEREIELIVRGRNTSRDIFLIDDLRIYEDGPFEMGAITHLGSKVLPEKRGVGFIDTLLGRSHKVERLYLKTGYIVALPRDAAAAIGSVEYSSPAARAALARNDLEDAQRIADGVRISRPDDSEALFILALVARRRGDLAGAREKLQRVLATSPRHVEAQGTLGVVLQDLNLPADAEKAYRLALEIEPKAMAILFNLGNLLLRQGRVAEAAPLYRRAVEAEPGFSQAHLALTSALHRLGDIAGAVTALSRTPPPATAFAPDYARLVGALQRAGAEFPLGVWEQMSRLEPADKAVQLQLATSLADVGRSSEARAGLHRLMDDEAASAGLLFEIGKVFGKLGDDRDAADAYRRALAKDPAIAAAHNNLSMILFLDGRFEEAWPHHEWRFEAKGRKRPTYPGPELTTQDVTGRTLFLHGEQGLGDNVQFLRYAKILRERGNRIVIGVRNELADLFRHQPYVEEVVADGGTLPSYDFHLPLLSLPALFRTRLDNVPAEIPYLHVPEDRLAQWRSRLKDVKTPRIGLVWAGNPNHYNDANRSIPGDVFLKLTEMPGLSFVSLQKPWPSGTPKPATLIELGTEFPTFLDTAAALMQLDLVISVDTSVAHLAGALGRPVWVMLPDPCDWRWTRNGDTTPWYKQARLFRQTMRGDWMGVVDRIRRELAAFRPR